MIAAIASERTGRAATPASEYTFRIARDKSDRVSAFRLVYENYVRQGLIEPNLYQLRVTPYHLLPTTAMFVAVRRDRVEAAVTLIGDGQLGLPMEEIHPELVAEARLRGLYVGEVSCLAFRRSELKTFRPVFVQVTRLMAQFARSQGMAQLLIGCIPQHSRFYRKFLGFEQVGTPRPYPTVRNVLGVACCLDFAKIDRERPPCYESFFGTALPPDELEMAEMSQSEREAYQDVAESSDADHLLSVP